MSSMAESHASAKQWPVVAMLGFVTGTALPLQQPQLWTARIYPAICALGALVLALLFLYGHRVSRIKGGGMLPVLAFIAAGCCGGGMAGWRASSFLDDCLIAAVEGRDVEVVGVVAAMPHRSEAGLHSTFDVESAVWADRKEEDIRSVTLPKLPPRLCLAWYASNTAAWSNTGRVAAETPLLVPDGLHAGERWQMTVRLKTPHGTLNPHGFDCELWMWEAGLAGSRPCACRRAGQRTPAHARHMAASCETSPTDSARCRNSTGSPIASWRA